MSNNLYNVFSNTIEDFFDDYSTTVVFKESKKALDPLKKKFDSDNQSDFDNAVQSAIVTLQMGISMYAVRWINSVILPSLYKRATIAFEYIFVGTLAKKLKNISLGGKFMRKTLRMVSDMFDQRQKNTEIAINMMNHQDNMMMQQMNVATKRKSSFDASMLKGYSEQQLKSVELMTHKTKTGTWLNTSDDKKLYERATGGTLKRGVSWSKMYKTLNSFQEFAVNAEGQVLNDAQVRFDTFVGQGLAGVK